ncbi:MAG TPA: GNAT family N-acetyltransferase [Verrucomicrobiae bacterium]|nr:GNAT family N-acetyltransferase [Verrucomicrobiae bacterium]
MSTGATSDSQIEIRPATEQDAALIHHFIVQLAAYEKLTDGVTATPEGIRRSLFGEQKCAEVLLAFLNGSPAGFAVYFFNFSTFLAKPGLYLEDLFVKPELRGRGIGKRLFAELFRIAQARGCGRFEWCVLNWNELALRFYESLGARAQREWIIYRLDEAQIASRAAGAS